jgi:hypothetical protein
VNQHRLCSDALLHACASACADDTGRCELVEGHFEHDQYRCECEYGSTAWTRAWVCEDALTRFCHPACESARGECYWRRADRDFGCVCAGASELHVTADADFAALPPGCDEQLRHFCGE